MAGLNLQMFNTVYADRDGNIFYVYNGTIPRRDPSFDWTKPVDGSNPKTEWQGLHTFDDLPQISESAVGLRAELQRHAVCRHRRRQPVPDRLSRLHGGRAERRQAPLEGFADAVAQIARCHVRRLAAAGFRHHAVLAAGRDSAISSRAGGAEDRTTPTLAAKVEPLLAHLADWDCRSSTNSTQTTLCAAWYQELYGTGYPAENLKPEFQESQAKRFQALFTRGRQAEGAVWRLEGALGRHQPHAAARELCRSGRDSVRRQAGEPGLPGAPGPLGVVFNTYYTPITPERRKQYGVVGHSFVGVYEFSKDEKVKAKPRSCNSAKAPIRNRRTTSTRPNFTCSRSSNRPGSIGTKSSPTPR